MIKDSCEVFHEQGTSSFYSLSYFANCSNGLSDIMLKSSLAINVLVSSSIEFIFYFGCKGIINISLFVA